MGEELIVLNPEDVQQNLTSYTKSIDKVSSAMNVIESIRDLAPLIQDTLNVADSIAKTYYSFKKLELTLDFKLKDNRDRRELIIDAFQKGIEHLQNVTNRFLDKIDAAPDDKSKDRYMTLLLDVITKSDNLTLELIKRI